MELTKFEHACFSLTTDNQTLLIDPGVFTSDLKIADTIVGVIITHEHPDHFDVATLRKIISINPHVTIIGHDSIMRQINELQTISVDVGDTISIGAFDMAFYGGEHAHIRDGLPPLVNLGVLINQKVYYPGDSFAVPAVEVDVLALPVGAPWLKLSETIDFLSQVKPRLAFPTHDAVLSSIGKSIVDNHCLAAAESIAASYQRLSNQPFML